MKKILMLMLTIVMSATIFAQKIAIVNTQEVFAKYSETKRVQQMLTEEKNKLENEIRMKEVEIQKLGVELQAKGAAVTDAEKEGYQKQAQALEQFVRGAQSRLSQKEYQEMNSIQSTIDASIQTVANQKGFDLVFESGAVKFGGEDITEDVLGMMEGTKKIEL